MEQYPLRQQYNPPIQPTPTPFEQQLQQQLQQPQMMAIAPEMALHTLKNSMGTVSDDSLQEILSKGVGRFMVGEFLIGTSGIQMRSGVLLNVGKSYLVLHDITRNVTVTCDIYSLKFANFYRPGAIPALIDAQELMNKSNQSGLDSQYQQYNDYQPFQRPPGTPQARSQWENDGAFFPVIGI